MLVQSDVGRKSPTLVVMGNQPLFANFLDLKLHEMDTKILRLPFPMGSGEWELYDIVKDPGETTDLSAQHPDIKNQLIRDWNVYAKVNGLHDHKGHYDSMYRKRY